MRTRRKSVKNNVQLATRIDERVKIAVQEFCESKGLIMARFIEAALIEKLEEIEDLEDLKKIRREPARPFSEVVAELNLGGKKVSN